jgi:hypothetical protein
MLLLLALCLDQLNTICYFLGMWGVFLKEMKKRNNKYNPRGQKNEMIFRHYTFLNQHYHPEICTLAPKSIYLDTKWEWRHPSWQNIYP